MKKLILPAAVAMALASATATVHAQQSPQTSKGSSASERQAAGDSSVRAMSQSKLRESLQKAGFTDVRIVDAQYMVHAKTSDGDPVVMFINPPSVQDSATTGAGSGTTSGAAGGSSTGSSGTTPGTKSKQ